MWHCVQVVVGVKTAVPAVALTVIPFQAALHGWLASISVKDCTV